MTLRFSKLFRRRCHCDRSADVDAREVQAANRRFRPCVGRRVGADDRRQGAHTRHDQVSTQGALHDD